MIDPAELPDHIRAEIEADRVTGPEEMAGRAAAEAELIRLKARFAELQASGRIGMFGVTPSANEVESAEHAARRFAGELQRLQDGLIAAGVRVDPNAPVDQAAVDSALATITALKATNERQAERLDHDAWDRLTVERDQLREQILNAPVSRVDVFGDAWPVDKALWPSNGLGIPAAVAAITARHGNDSVVALVDLAEVAKAIEAPGPVPVAGAQDEAVSQEWVYTPADQHAREQEVIAAARAAAALELGTTSGPRYPVRRALIDAVDRLDASDEGARP